MSQNKQNAVPQAVLYPTIEAPQGVPTPAPYPVYQAVHYIPISPVQVQSPPTEYVKRGKDEEAAKEPLLESKKGEKKYHPKQVVVYAKSSRRNCVCVSICCALTCCCCLMFLAAAIFGAIVAGFAIQCNQHGVSDTLMFSADGTNLDQLDFSSTWGKITFKVQPDTTNVTIQVDRKAMSKSDLEKFETTWIVNASHLTFGEEVPLDGNIFVSMLGCRSTDITVSLPLVFIARNGSISITSTSGDITFDFDSMNMSPFQSINIHTTNGDLEFTNLAATSLSAKTENGGIKFNSVNSTSISCTTTNGDYSLDLVVAQSISLETLNGDIHSSSVEVFGTNPSITATTTNGDVKFETVDASASGLSFHISSTNGDLSASLSNTYASFVLSNSNGDIDVSGNDVKLSVDKDKHKEGTGGNGPSSGATLNFQTTNGDISLNFI